MALNTLRAVEALTRGTVVFGSDVEPITLGTLNGMVANSEIVKCEHGEFTFYFAMVTGENESMADKAYQMAKATRGQCR